jgi:site-specific DNA-methyltransferase (adenine-specific)
MYSYIKTTDYIYGFSEILHLYSGININVRWIVWHYTNKVTPSINFTAKNTREVYYVVIKKNQYLIKLLREPYTDAFHKTTCRKE